MKKTVKIVKVVKKGTRAETASTRPCTHWVG